MYTYHTPPQCVRVCAKFRRILLFFSEKHEERREDQTQEADVQRREKFLWNENKTVSADTKCTE